MPEDADPVAPEVRERIEDRWRGKTWRIYVCGERDGENCGSGLGGVPRHECAAGRRRRGGEGDSPLEVWITVIPQEYEKK